MLNPLTRNPFTRSKALLVCVGILSLMGCSNGEVVSSAPDSDTLQTREVAAAPQDTETTTNLQSQESTAPTSIQPTSTQPTSVQPTSVQPTSVQPTSVQPTSVQPTSTQSKDSDSNVFVNISVGGPYAEARNRLMRQGWIPEKLPAPGPYGVERMAYEAGFTEVSACAGTGAGQCRFEFRHDSANKVLSVITVGGADLNVSDWVIGTPGNLTPTVSTSTPAEIAAVPAPAVIPAAFQGEWNANRADCAANPSTTGSLMVQLDKLKFWETISSVESVTRRGDREITVISKAYSEGSTFTQTKTFRLSEDDWSMTDVETGSVWYRCVGRFTGVPTASKTTTAVNDTTKNTELTEIPNVFRGTWDSAQGQCDAPFSEGRLTITANKYTFWETTGTVNSVTVTGEREITVTATASSEGAFYEDTITFGISEEASVLTYGDGGNFVKFRCPD